MLTKTEKKIRMRLGKRIKYIEEKKLPKAPFMKRLLDFWKDIESWLYRKG